MAGPAITAVEIVTTPFGEAPVWVREAWVGLTLPLVPGRGGKGSFATVGVLSGPHTYWPQLWLHLTGRVMRIEGYLVDREAAFDLLGGRRPDALAWWRAETEVGKRGKGGLIFDAPACQPVYAG